MEYLMLVVKGAVAVIGMLSVIINTLNLVTLWNYNCKQIFRRSVCDMVACLSIADLLTGANCVLWGLQGRTGFYPSPILLTIYWTTVQVSFLTVLLMAIDRFIAVTYPTNNEAIVSRRRTLICCSLIWIISSSVGVVISFNRIVGQFICCVLFEATILAVVVMYALIYRKARAISKLAHSGQARDNGTLRSATRESRLYIVVLFLVGILVATVLPYVLAIHVELSYRITSPESKLNITLRKFIDFYLPVELLNFLVNPIVYAWRLSKYRIAVLKTLSCNHFGH